MPKGRPYEFPDPDDRSANEPAIIVKAPHILGLYNQAHPEEQPMIRVAQSVQDWFEQEALKEHWSSAEFAGNECILRNNDVHKHK